MTDRDILEKIRGIYDEKEPDVLTRLNFADVEMVTSDGPRVKRKYLTAAAVYAAACLVLVIALPFVIGGMVEDPETPVIDPGSNPVTETNAPEPDVISEDVLINEFMEALERAVNEGRIKGTYRREDCRYITTDEINSETGAMLFKFEGAMDSFVFVGGEVYCLGQNNGDYGMISAVPCDFNEDGIKDILFIEEFELSYTRFSVFNMKTKKYEEFHKENTSGLSLTTGKGKNGETRYYVNYSTGFANNLPCVAVPGDDIYGEIVLKDGKPVLQVYEESDPNVEEFMAALEKAVEEGKVTGTFSEKRCVNFTTNEMRKETDAMLFWFSNTLDSFIYVDGEVYQINTDATSAKFSYGGVMTCDFDGNGVKDLLIEATDSAGGFSILFFDMETKTASALTTDTGIAYNVVKNDTDNGTVYTVYNNYSNYTPYGEIIAVNGKPVMFVYDYSAEETDPAETTAAPEAPDPSDPGETPEVTTPAVTTPAPEPEPEPEDPTPEDMVYVEHKNYPYTFISYSGGWIEELGHLLGGDEILVEAGMTGKSDIRLIQTKAEFDEYMAEILKVVEKHPEYEGAFVELAKDYEYYTEEFFEEHEIVMWSRGETVLGIDYSIDDLILFKTNLAEGQSLVDLYGFKNSVAYNSDQADQLFNITFVKNVPSADVAERGLTTELRLIVFDKDDLEGITSDMRNYSGITSINSYKKEETNGKTDAVLMGSGSEGKDDYKELYYCAPYVHTLGEAHVHQQINFLFLNTLRWRGENGTTGAYDLTYEQAWDGEIPIINATFWTKSLDDGQIYRVEMKIIANERAWRYTGRDYHTSKIVKDPDHILGEREVFVSEFEDVNSDSFGGIDYTRYLYKDKDGIKALIRALGLKDSDLMYAEDKRLNTALPVDNFIIDDYHDYTVIMDKLKKAGSKYGEGTEVYEFLKEFGDLDEAYFENNVLVLAPYIPVCSDTDSEGRAYLIEHSKTVHITIRGFVESMNDVDRYTDPEYCLHVFRFDRDDIDRAKEIDSTVYNEYRLK